MTAARTFTVIGAIVGVGVWGWFAGQHDAAVLAGPNANLGWAETAEAKSGIPRLGDRLRLQLRRERAELRAARRDAARWRAAVQSDPEITNGIRLAATTYGVDAGWLLAIATCESGVTADATNGRYVGLMQFGTPLWSTTPYSDWSRFDPYASALAAAWAIDRGYASHWACA